MGRSRGPSINTSSARVFFKEGEKRKNKKFVSNHKLLNIFMFAHCTRWLSANNKALSWLHSRCMFSLQPPEGDECSRCLRAICRKAPEVISSNSQLTHRAIIVWADLGRSTTGMHLIVLRPLLFVLFSGAGHHLCDTALQKSRRAR